jgi:16S rRNA (guanine527-N7)-methyltransferase
VSEQSSPLPLLASGSRALGIDLDREQLGRFSILSRELRAGNQRANLTALTDRGDVEIKHFLDSLTVAPIIQQELPAANGRLVDVGSGGGFPGLALAIALPWLQVMLVEATAKKVRFLEQVTETLQLSNVGVLQGRAEALADGEQREGFDIATARAVGSAATLVELLTPFLRVGGLAVLMKTRSAVQGEIVAAAGALERLHAVVEGIHDVQVKGLDERVLVLVRKTRPTPPGYPRRAGVPERRPLTH